MRRPELAHRGRLSTESIKVLWVAETLRLLEGTPRHNPPRLSSQVKTARCRDGDLSLGANSTRKRGGCSLHSARRWQVSLKANAFTKRRAKGWAAGRASDG